MLRLSAGKRHCGVRFRDANVKIHTCKVRNDGPSDEALILPILRSVKFALPHSRVEHDTSGQDELVQFALQGGRRVCSLPSNEDLGVCMIIEDFRPATERQHSSFVRLVSKFRVRLIEPPQLHEALLAKVASKAIQKRTVQCMYARVREHQGQEE
eukprot:g10929.t1